MMIPDNNMRLLRKLGHPSLGLGMGLRSGGGSAPFNPAILFAGGVKGLIWDFSVASSVYQDAGTTPGVIDSPIGRVIDQSPNAAHGNQATAGSKPTWKTSGGKYFALFDGSDDDLATSAIDFSGTDKMTVVAGVRKLSDAGGFATIAELTSNGGNGSFSLWAPGGAGTPTYQAQSKGTIGQGGAVSGFPAPVSSVVTLLGNVSGDSYTLRINGVALAVGAGDQGAGNFSNAAVYVGRRGGASLPFNGQIHCLVVLGRLCTASELTALEAWANARTGAY